MLRILFNFSKKAYSQDLEHIYDFSNFSELQKNELIEEIFKEQQEIGENLPNQNMRCIFLFEINETFKDKKVNLFLN